MIRWSHSGARAFFLCPRKWYYQTYYGHPRANDPARREAARLKRLVNVRAWRGRVVDDVISNYVLPRVQRGIPTELADMHHAADLLVQRDMAGLNGHERPDLVSGHHGQSTSFFEAEYGTGPTAVELDRAKADINTALTNFAKSNAFRDLQQSADRAIAQRPLSFKYGDITVRAVPDVVAFYHHRPPAIIDWKVQEPHFTQNAQQLILYGMALNRVNPHKDFPPYTRSQLDQVGRFSLVESQLLRDEEFLYRVNENDLDDVEDFIFTTSCQMAAAFDGKPTGNLSPELFPTARSANICSTCNFKKICWPEAAT